MKRLIPGSISFLFLLIFLAVAPWGAEAGVPARAHPGSYGPQPTPNPGDWPMYGRDLQRTNFNPDETAINAGNVNQLVERWRFNLGNTSPTSGAPSVANGRIYAGSSITTGDNFFARDAVTGAHIWSTSVGHGFNCFSVGIGSSSVVSGSVLSVGGGDQSYYGLNADTGGQLWREPMNVGTSGFPWASPLLAYGRSYLGMASCADNPSVRGEVRSVDMVTGGDPASQYFVPAANAGAGVWNSPALSPDGSALVVTTGEDFQGYNGPYNRAIVSLDPITLAILQSNQQGPLGGDVDYATTPLFFSDSLGRNLVGALHKNSVFYAFELNTINNGPVWSRSVSIRSAGLMPAYDPTFGTGGTLFVPTTNNIYALNPDNGTDRWPAISVSGLHGNIALANGLMFMNVAGNLQVRDRANGSLLRTITPTTGGSTYTGPVVSHGFVYWLSGAWLNAWSLPAGSTPTPGPSSTPTNTPASTNTPTTTNTPSNTPTFNPTNTPTRTPTNLATITRTPTSGIVLSSTPTPPPPPTFTATTQPEPTVTSTPTLIPTATPTACTLQFDDVPPESTFYPFIRCLSCLGIINGYPCGGPGEPCNGNNDPYFRPGNQITRGQLSKIVSESAGFQEPHVGQTFEDVPPASTFYAYIERLATRGIMQGYPCGNPEPCVPPGNLPYFRPGNNATRGQIAKIVSNAAGLGGTPTDQTFEDVPPDSTFWLWIERLSATGAINGYDCGHPEPCVPPGNRPYFRPGNSATRGQVSKIVSSTFFPACDPLEE
jgi:outer membrane protein assembly factor BamB